jgi:hypothetical protein
VRAEEEEEEEEEDEEEEDEEDEEESHADDADAAFIADGMEGTWSQFTKNKAVLLTFRFLWDKYTGSRNGSIDASAYFFSLGIRAQQYTHPLRLFPFLPFP